ncbi:8-amino-7-oxononanoate synthase [Methanocaldococcus villosus KIN24-T80]|uniref:8-amino-7-ketopelargonate synthase n=1 Tax=Methanocaldococcus villosus KIN24-T80 TaxID=1069083 RepID=N6UUC7_9EURY|nr:8-amino-7-oxononanoate synthase [Methanocaldococcus villosus]ENN95949.1 8-amino-7-oxononanoate synthase [Methanocaldococcus villosus KIN24-T80]
MFREVLKKEIDKIKDNNLYRELRKVKGINFSSNDYLCLSKHPEVIEALKNGAKYGVGSTGSRLTSGNINHEKLEEKMAKFKGTESSLLYPTGYMANLSISAICKKGDLILSDELNHASIIDGCRLSKADRLIYKHCDTNHLLDLLEKNYKNYNNIFIITDSVFSMDGDIAPLNELKKIADDFGAVLILDDAHATGVLGNGKGALEYFNIKPDDNIIIIVTLSKAIGCLGGCVCGVEELKDYLINTSRSFIFTTALPPAIVEAAIKAIEIIEEGKVVKKLKKNINLANKIFKSYNFINRENETPIYPFIFRDKTVKIAEYLIKNNIFCIPIRYPTVPKGSERIRISINVEHMKEDFIILCEKIKELW